IALSPLYLVVANTKHVTCNIFSYLHISAMAASIASLPPPGWDGEGLDGLLAAFLPGRLSEIVGPRSSGGGSLLLALLSRASARGGGAGGRGGGRGCPRSADGGGGGARSPRALGGPLWGAPGLGVECSGPPGALPGLGGHRARSRRGGGPRPRRGGHPPAARRG